MCDSIRRRFFLTSVTCFLLMNVGQCLGFQPTCNSLIVVHNKGTETPTELLSLSAKQLNASLVAELKYNDSPALISSGSISFQDLLFVIDPALTCSVIEGVLYVADPDVTKHRSNALNYLFTVFNMPQNIDQFRLSFRARLREEPWEKADSRNLMRSGIGGGVAADSDQFPLKDETLRKVTARAILLRAASEQHLITILQLPVEEDKSDSKSNWMWIVLPAN